jgi:hypothetical protein
MMDQNRAAENIIHILANLPDFLRKPMLQRRLKEFYAMNENDQCETINMALSASSAIDQKKLAMIFKTWLEILSEFDASKRMTMFQIYCRQLMLNPHFIQGLDLNLLTTTFQSLDSRQRELISDSLNEVLFSFPNLNKILSLVPNEFLQAIGIKR